MPAGVQRLLNSTTPFTISDAFPWYRRHGSIAGLSARIIADSIEAVSGLHWGHDGIIRHRRLPTRTMPAHHGLARLNRPAIFIYAHHFRPGKNHTGHQFRIRSRGLAMPRGTVSDIEASSRSRKTAIPGAGSLRRHVHRQHHGSRH